MKVGTEIKSLQSFIRQIKRADETGRISMALGVQKSAVLLHAKALRGIYATSQGEKQTRYNPKREVTVSVPGDPFNVDTGHTVGTIHWEMDAQAEPMEARVGSDDNVAYWLERGTEHMAARPWLWPAVQKVKDRFAGMFKFTRDNEADIG